MAFADDFSAAEDRLLLLFTNFAHDVTAAAATFRSAAANAASGDDHAAVATSPFSGVNWPDPAADPGGHSLNWREFVPIIDVIRARARQRGIVAGEGA